MRIRRRHLITLLCGLALPLMLWWYLAEKWSWRPTILKNGEPVRVVIFSSDGRRLASAGGPLVKIWDVRRRHLLATLRGHRDFVTSVAFSPDGKLLASCSKGEALLIWD